MSLFSFSRRINDSTEHESLHSNHNWLSSFHRCNFPPPSNSTLWVQERWYLLSFKCMRVWSRLFAVLRFVRKGIRWKTAMQVPRTPGWAGKHPFGQVRRWNRWKMVESLESWYFVHFWTMFFVALTFSFVIFFVICCFCSIQRQVMLKICDFSPCYSYWAPMELWATFRKSQKKPKMKISLGTFSRVLWSKNLLENVLKQTFAIFF